MERRVPLAAFLPVIAVIGIYASGFVTFLAASVHAKASAGGIDPAIVGLANFERFLLNDAAFEILGRTFWVAAYLTFITLLLSYPMAYFIVRTRSSKLRRALLGIVMLTFLSGGITRAYAWMVVLGNTGLVNRTLGWLGIDRIQLLYNQRGVGIALVHFLIPFCVLTLVGVFQTMNRNIEEAAISLGASRSRAFWEVTFPITAPGAVGAAILTYSLAVSAFSYPLLLGGGRVQFVSNYIYDILFVNFDIPYAAATAAIFLVATLAVMSMLPLILRFAIGHRLKRSS
jgi:putative spermidine/putrescine transport system permease protein